MSVELLFEATVHGSTLASIRERVDAVLEQVDAERDNWEITIKARRSVSVDGAPVWVADVTARATEGVSYALDSESLSIIVDAAARLHPTMAVEYGSGVSTAALAGHCGSLLSLEHDRQWLAVTRARLNGVDNVEVRWCRLTRGTYSVTLPDEISFALIDGPRIRDGRQSTLPQLWPSLAPGALVFVDDLHHRPVQRWVDDWRLTLGAQLELLTERLGVIVR